MFQANLNRCECDRIRCHRGSQAGLWKPAGYKLWRKLRNLTDLSGAESRKKLPSKSINVI